MSIDNLDLQPIPTAEPTDLNATPNPEQKRKLPVTRIVIPLFLQSLLICSLSAQSIYALATGTTVVLKTMPVDPYDLLRGYYQTLSYDISSFNTLKNLSGWQDLKHPSGSANIPKHQQIYVTLTRAKAAKIDTPQAWQPVAISGQIPTNLSADKIAIRGVSNGNNIIYGLETYYLPEDRKDSMNRDINNAQISAREGTPVSSSNRNLLVEIKVDNRGIATPVSLWVGERQYQF
jgi:uncharacterized membrane-anchored protein